MKPLLLFFTVILFCVATQAQIQLEDFYKKGSSWCEYEMPWVPRYTPGITRYRTWTISEDSIVNNQKYHLLIYSGHDNQNNPVYRNALVGGVRISHDSVYFIRLFPLNWPGTYPRILENYFDGFPIGTEVLLYNFDIKIGDTVGPAPIEHIVTEIDSITMSNGDILPRYKLTVLPMYGGGWYYWMRGIGSTSGFFGPYMGVDKIYGKLGFYFNDNFYYAANQPPHNPSGCFPLSIEDVHSRNRQPLTFYPNPLTDNTLHIISPGIEKLSIIDITGKVVCVAIQLAPSNQTINVDLPAGIYILKAQLADGTTEVRKIIKQ